LEAAQRHGVVRLDVVTELPGLLGDGLRCRCLERLDGRDVTAAVDVGPYRLEAVVVEVPVVGLVGLLPADLERRRLVDKDGRLVEAALLDSGGVDDRLERAARLPVGLGRAVELAGG